MLFSMTRVVRAKPVAVARCGSRVGNGVKFVVSHDSQACAGINHALNDFKSSSYFRSSIYEITNEDGHS